MSFKPEEEHSETREHTGEDAMEARQQQAVDMGASTIRTRDGTIHTLTIIGQIEGHQEAPAGAKTTKYEHVLPILTAVEESCDVDGLLILLNTMGGDIEAGLAIAEMIAGMRKPTVSLVLGGGHSIGVPLAVAAAFHSKLMQPAADAIAAAFTAIPFAPPTVPFYTNLTGEPLAEGTDMAQYCAKHCVSPVRFAQEFHNLYAAGFDTYIELGPKKVLTSFVKQTLKDVDMHTVTDPDSLEETVTCLKHTD